MSLFAIHRHGTGFEVHIWLTIPPPENVVVNDSASGDTLYEHAKVAVRCRRRQVDALAA
jgi:hypothetical protein